MIRETYKGRQLIARSGRDGIATVTCGGEPVSVSVATDAAAELASVKAMIDLVDQDTVDGDRWAAHWYAPGTYEMCQAGPHPQDIGGPCRHSTCAAGGAS